MTDLERRALLGDSDAQNECTEKGIVLPCPFCGAEKAKVRYACADYFVECLKCHCTSSVTSTKETVIKDWNTRPAPPIGRCGECVYSRNVKPNGKGFNICPASGMEITDTDFCSYFEPKED